MTNVFIFSYLPGFQNFIVGRGAAILATTSHCILRPFDDVITWALDSDCMSDAIKKKARGDLQNVIIL